MTDMPAAADYIAWEDLNETRIPGTTAMKNKGMGRGRLLFIVTPPRFFLTHRLPLARAAREAGYDVHIASSQGPDIDRIEAEFPFHLLPLDRYSTNPWLELKALSGFYRLYKELRPDLIHLVTIKPILYGGLAARLVQPQGMVFAVAGLGHVFVSTGFKSFLIRLATKTVYPLALGHKNKKVIFQNPQDREALVKGRMVKEKDTVLIRGSGVDLNQYQPRPEPEGQVTILLPTRLLWEKGVEDFVEAARLLKEAGSRAEFVVAGEVEEPGSASVPQDRLLAWQESGLIDWLGYREDMPEVYARAHIVCLPSYYAEGLPKVLLEAAASGRPCVTTDRPGCRDAVRDGQNGLLVPPRDPGALALALARLIESPRLRRKMGLKGREMVEAEFSIESVVEKTINLYEELMMAK